MNLINKKRLLTYTLLVGALSFEYQSNILAQTPVGADKSHFLLNHGTEQYLQGHYNLSLTTIKNYIKFNPTNIEFYDPFLPEVNHENAQYLSIITALRLNALNSAENSIQFIKESTVTPDRQRVSFALAQYYFRKDQLVDAIKYYELSGIANLSNSEIADAKFELAYCYFNNGQLDKAKPLFAAMKEVKDGKYYLPGNYYYGLLAFNDQNYDQAMRSFKRIDQEPDYKDIVPFYEAEIYYYQRDYNNVYAIGDKYLNGSEKLYYDKDLHLLLGQSHFEQNQYQQALPYFQYYYDNSETVRKEELYELAYAHYKTFNYDKAALHFKELSGYKDSLGQSAMYLLGDCYLKTNHKKAARNAFELCSAMDFNPELQEESSFLAAKLSYELGDDAVALNQFKTFIGKYPSSIHINESRKLQSSLLASSNDFQGAMDIIDQMPFQDEDTKAIYERASVGRGIQLMQNKDYATSKQAFEKAIAHSVNKNYEAVAHFWLSELAYRNQDYTATAQNALAFIQLAKGREKEISKISSKATMQNAQINLGYAQMQTDDFKGAQQTFSEAGNISSEGSSTSTAATALVRQADAAFMQKDMDKALALYDKALSQGASEKDYITYQKALIYGLNDKKSQENSLLQSINKQSSYYEDAQYGLAVNYLESDQNDKAVSILQNLAQNATKPSIQAKAAYKLAYAYQQENRNDQALTSYKSFLQKYPSSPDRQAALDAVRTIYVQKGTPDEYASFLKEQNMPDDNAKSLESAYYDAAENEYTQQHYQKAAELFTKYLSNYPNGTYAAEALYYNGESYYGLANYSDALINYNKLIQLGTSDYQEAALTRAAEINMHNANYKDAVGNYNQLVAVNPDTKITVYEGLMKAYSKLNQPDSVIYISDQYLALPNINNSQKANALLQKANAQKVSGFVDDAYLNYKNVDALNDGASSAEATYNQALILFEQGKYAEAENAADAATKKASGHNYWLIKDYLLLGDISMAQKDYFNAEATYSSVVKVSNIKELTDEAKTKLKEAQQKAKNKSK